MTVTDRLLESFRRVERHPVDLGRVSCELRGTDVHVDRCQSCPWMLEVNVDDNSGSVRCRPMAAAVVAAHELRIGGHSRPD